MRRFAAACFIAGLALLPGLPGELSGIQLETGPLRLGTEEAAVAEHLVARGVLTGLDAFRRPLDPRSVRAALAAVDPSGLSTSDLDRIQWLAQRIGAAPPGAGWRVAAVPTLGLQAGTTARRTLLLEGPPGEVWPLVALDLSAVFGPFRVQVAPRWEDRLLDDPDYPERFRGDDAGLALRLPSALLRGDWPWVSVEIGEMEGNWGPPGVPGLLVSPLGYHRRGLGLELGPEVLRFEWRVERLRPGIGPESGEPLSRWFSRHRLRWRAGPDFEVAVWEAMITADEAGVDPAALNPFAPYTFGRQFGIGDSRNVSLGLDVAWRAAPALRLEGQFLLDDAVVWKADENPYPHRFGFTLQARGPLGDGAAWRGYTTGLSALALVTSDSTENFTEDGIGFGRLRPDHLEAGVDLTVPVGARVPAGAGGASAPRSSLLPGAGLVTLGLRWRRQGVRRLTDPWPSPEGGGDLPAFSREIEREVSALHMGLVWSGGPVTLEGTAQLQHRRFPVGDRGAEWGLEGRVGVVWRVGRWSGGGPGSAGSATPSPPSSRK